MFDKSNSQKHQNLMQRVCSIKLNLLTFINVFNSHPLRPCPKEQIKSHTLMYVHTYIHVEPRTLSERNTYSAIFVKMCMYYIAQI